MQNDDDASDMARAIRASREAHAKRLGKAKAEATSQGKEAYDLGKLEQLCDTSHEGRMGSLDERRARGENRC